MSEQRTAASASASPAPQPPDPALGVFETMLVVGGRPIALDRHLRRLDASVRALYGAPAPTAAAERVGVAAADLELGRLRLALTPDAGALGCAIAVAEVDRAIVFPGWERAVDLRPLVVEHGLGAHKWLDRRLLTDAEAADPGTVALVVDSDGSVLEASRANVFAVSDGVASTAPADGRLLPGIARAEVADVLDELGIELREERLTSERLAAADELFLTGSVRGVEPVRSLAGVGSWAPGATTARVSAALRRRWLGD